ncbi:MAG: VIT1/CCC1 transporter family protein [Actinomycetota bacterium]|nr:VIT1/CCC1 transporter family protein [Actinomycetota bacterium]
MANTAVTEVLSELHDPEHQHRDVRGGSARAAVFGISDGLVSNASLILGMEGAHPAAAAVRLAGFAGLLGGALSMAAGELISMRAQAELLERELAVERAEIQRHPEGELRELVLIYERRGVAPAVAQALALEMMATPERALETHAREELGIDPNELGSPLAAAFASFASFALGALVPLVAVLVSRGAAAGVLAICLSAAGAAAVGTVLAHFSGRSRLRLALRQVGVCAGAAIVTFAVGTLIGHLGGL